MMIFTYLKLKNREHVNEKDVMMGKVVGIQGNLTDVPGGCRLSSKGDAEGAKLAQSGSFSHSKSMVF